jgi:hypothetical protein
LFVTRATVACPTIHIGNLPRGAWYTTAAV